MDEGGATASDKKNKLRANEMKEIPVCITSAIRHLAECHPHPHVCATLSYINEFTK